MEETRTSPKTKRFSVRALTSLTVTLSFLCLAFSGVILYLTPKGRVAHWVGWTMLGLEKEEWAAVHTTLAILFVVASAFHVYFNWRALLRYFVDALRKGINSRAELGIATLLTALFFVGTVYMWQPFATVVEWGDQIKDYWERTSAPPPYAHAEESTLAEFAASVGLSFEELAERLKASGLVVSDPSMTVDALAREHGVTPQVVFDALPEARASQPQRGSGSGGGGFGQQTLQAVCDEAGIELGRGIAALERRGIRARGNDTVKSLAAQVGMRPRELVDILRAAP